MAIIEAFRRAFPQRNDVQLVIKSQNGQYHSLDLDPVLEGNQERFPDFVDRRINGPKRRYHLMNACDSTSHYTGLKDLLNDGRGDVNGTKSV